MGSRKKVVIVGDAECGKTSLQQAARGNELHSYEPKDFGPIVIDVNGDHGQMDVVVCEITEQPPSMRESALFSLYKDAEVVIVCYAVDNEETLDHVVDKWIPEVHQFLPKNVPIVLVGCKKDLRNDPATRAALKLKRQKPVSEEEGRAMAERIGAAAYVECSALTKDGVREVFETVINPTVGRAKCRIL